MLKSYKELKVWQKSYQLCLEVYKTTKGFPKEEAYGLSAQMRRAATSIPSNIAEGYGRSTRPDYLRFLSISYGSICELETQLLLSKDLMYISAEEMQRLHESLNETERMLKKLMGLLQPKHP